MKNLREETILTLAVQVPFSEKPINSIKEILSNYRINWELFVDLAASRQILPIAVKNLLTIISSDMPKDILIKYNEQYRKRCCANQLILWDEFKKILAMAEDRGIPLMPIKGLILMEIVYGDLGARWTSDVDFLIKKEDAPRIESMLLDMGYQWQPEEASIKNFIFDNQHHFGLLKKCGEGRSVTVDAHWETLGAVTRIPNLVDDFWKNSVVRVISGQHVRSLSTEDLLLESIIELYKDMYCNSNFILKRDIDIAHILLRYHSMIDWDEFVSRVRQYGIESLVYYAFISNKALSDMLFLPKGIIRRLSPSFCKRVVISRTPAMIKFSNNAGKFFLTYFILRVILLPRYKVFLLGMVFYIRLRLTAWRYDPLRRRSRWEMFLNS